MTTFRKCCMVFTRQRKAVQGDVLSFLLFVPHRRTGTCWYLLVMTQQRGKGVSQMDQSLSLYSFKRPLP